MTIIQIVSTKCVWLLQSLTLTEIAVRKVNIIPSEDIHSTSVSSQQFSRR